MQSSISDPEERKLAMAELLQNETKALQGLQKLKLSAQRELQVEKTQQMLERMSMPHVWQLSRGEAAQVTPNDLETIIYCSHCSFLVLSVMLNLA